MNKERIPLGWIVDDDGHDTDDPLDFCLQNGSVGENGRLLSFGARDGHKGYCLSILMEILGGILPGGGSIDDEDAHLYENGLLAIALDIKRFTPLQRFKNRMDSLFKKVHSVPVKPGFQYSEVQVPGDYEWRNREKRLTEEIDVPQPAWDQIQRLAAELNINSKHPSTK
jgi:LDH2 family malate/lactate/ureidoglycolate dehydrogenase